MVTTSHRQTTTQVKAEKIGPHGKTQCRTHNHPICSGAGGEHQECIAKYGIQTHFKGNKTLRQVLVKPKNQDPKEKKNGVTYSCQCGPINCGEEYIGEISRPLRVTLQRASQEALCHTCAQPTHQSSVQPRPIQHNRKGGPGPIHVNQRIYLH